MNSINSVVNQVQNQKLQETQALTSIQPAYSFSEIIKEAIKEATKVDIIQNQKQENVSEQKMEEQQDERKITEREQAQDEENVVFEQSEQHNQQGDSLFLAISDVEQNNATNVDYGSEFMLVEQSNVENVNQFTLETQGQQEILNNQFVNDTNLQIQQECAQRADQIIEKFSDQLSTNSNSLSQMSEEQLQNFGMMLYEYSENQNIDELCQNLNVEPSQKMVDLSTQCSKLEEDLTSAREELYLNPNDKIADTIYELEQEQQKVTFELLISMNFNANSLAQSAENTFANLEQNQKQQPEPIVICPLDLIVDEDITGQKTEELADSVIRSLGYQFLGKGPHQRGLDLVYQHPDGGYLSVEVKFNTSEPSILKGEETYGIKQFSDEYVENPEANYNSRYQRSRLEDAVGAELAADIIRQGYDKWASHLISGDNCIRFYNWEEFELWKTRS